MLTLIGHNQLVSAHGLLLCHLPIRSLHVSVALLHVLAASLHLPCSLPTKHANASNTAAAAAAAATPL